MRGRIVLPIVIVVVGVLATVALVRNRRAPARERPTPPAPLIRAEEVHAQPFRLDVASQGEVRPRTETVLVAEVGGRIVEVTDALAAGGFFSRGDLLARIDPRDYRIAVSHAQSMVAQAEVALAREEGESRVARADWESLGQGDADPLVLREPQLAGARAALASARAGLEKAELDLSRTEVRAPYDGRVRARSVDVGQFVTPGTPLGRVYASDAAEIRLGIPMERVGDLDLSRVGRGKGAPGVVLQADFGGAPARWEGRVVRVEGEIDPTTRMLHVIARVEDPFGRGSGRGDRDGMAMPAGLFVDADVEGRQLERAFVLPREALHESGRLLVVEDGKLRWRDVEVARASGDEVVVTAGLEDGELVCVSNPRIVTDGMAVRVSRTEVNP